MKWFRKRAILSRASGIPRKCKFLQASFFFFFHDVNTCTDKLPDSIRAILDANRNSLMLLDLKFSVGTLGLAMGTFLAGLYGMNLENFIEETNWGFGAVTAVSSIFSLLVCWYGLIKLRKVQRVRMNANDLRRTGGHWFREEGNVNNILLDSSNRERLRRLNMMKNAKQQRSRKWPFS